MKPKVAVVCFWWGKWPEDNPKLGAEYVRRLRDSVFRYSTVPVDFKVFLDLEKYFGNDLEHIGKYLIPSRFMDMRWNLKKISMFSNWAGLLEYEWVVCMDLDVVINSSIDFLLNHRSPALTTCMAAYQKDIGGSVIGFQPSQMWCENLVWWLLNNQEDLEKRTKGSERKLYRMAVEKEVLPNVRYWQAEFPRSISSYKVDGFSKDVPLVRFHGEPRPHQTEVWNHVG